MAIFGMIFPASRGKNRISQGVENRGSLISVPQGRADVWERNEDSNFSVFRVRRFTAKLNPPLSDILKIKSVSVIATEYPLTRNDYKNNSLRVIFRNFLRHFAISEISRK